MPASISPSTVAEVTQAGKAHGELIALEPARRPDLDFDGALQIVSIERFPLTYIITADLPRRLKQCKHCGSEQITLHGRYVIRLADLPHHEASGRALPVQYAVTAQRYQCSNCQRGDVEPLPDGLKPVVSKARITKRLSEWLLYTIQTETPYDTIARMTGYSKVWVRKWFKEVRTALELPPKPSRGARRKP